MELNDILADKVLDFEVDPKRTFMEAYTVEWLSGGGMTIDTVWVDAGTGKGVAKIEFEVMDEFDQFVLMLHTQRTFEIPLDEWFATVKPYAKVISLR